MMRLLMESSLDVAQNIVPVFHGALISFILRIKWLISVLLGELYANKRNIAVLSS